MSYTSKSQPANLLLYQRIAARDERALRQLIFRYSVWVQTRIYRIMKRSGSLYQIDKRDVEELAADVLYRVWQDIEQFDPSRAKFETWINMKTVYTVLEFQRKKAQEKVTLEYREEVEIRSSTTSVELYKENTLLQRYEEAVIQLPKNKRNIYELYATGKSLVEIAELTGKPKGTVKSTLNRIRKHLKIEVFEADID